MYKFLIDDSRKYIIETLLKIRAENNLSSGQLREKGLALCPMTAKGRLYERHKKIIDKLCDELFRLEEWNKSMSS